MERIVNKALQQKPKTWIKFADLFKEDVAKKITLNSWGELVDRPENQLALIGPIDNYQLLRILVENIKSSSEPHSINKVLIIYGIISFIRAFSVKEFKQFCMTHWNSDHPERLNSKILQASKLLDGLGYSNSIAFIDRELNRFEQIKLPFIDYGV